MNFVKKNMTNKNLIIHHVKWSMKCAIQCRESNRLITSRNN